MDLDLEADLGIDTVKQAEVFASIRESYGIERDDTIKLRDYPTLNHVVGFVRDRAGVAPAAEPAPEPEPTPEPEPVAVAEPEPTPEPEPVAVAEPEPTPEPEPVAETTAAPTDADIEAKVLEVVAEQTGYPTELLDMDLDLEADLGIDTVKQAEVFASIRESYGIERNDTLKLRDYPTLNHVVGFVKEHTGTSPEAQDTTQAASAETPAPEPIPHPVAEAPGFPRRVPVPVLRPPLDYCVPTNVTIEASKTRIVMMPDAGGVGKALAARLVKRGADVVTIEGAPTVEALEDQLAKWTEEGPINGVYWLPALDPEGPHSKLDARARKAALHTRVKLLAATMRAVPDTAFLVSATRLGGRHGYDEDGAANVFGGAVTGFTKALDRERSDAMIKAVDFGEEAPNSEIVDALIEETLTDPGAVEIGYADGLRWTIALEEQPAMHDPAHDLGEDTVFLVTGAAGSIVSAIIADLAKASRGTFHLLDLVPQPDHDDPDIVKYAADREGLKRELAERIRERGERPTPKLIERELAKLERAKAALDAIDAIEWGGGSAHWHQVDLMDPDQVAQAVATAQSQTKPIDVVVHAAGLEISHFLPDKPQQEYDLVFDVKAHGWLNLLAALDSSQPDDPPEAAIVFSSIAGRFGNGGQTDYSAANDLLCKSVSNMRQTGRTRGTAVDWTAWASIGMAARGSIPKMMEMAGIEMLPPEVGIPVVRRELTAGNTVSEIVEAGSLGIMAEEHHETGGLDVERATAKLADHAGPMTGRVVAFSSDGVVTIATELDPTRQAFLNDHRIDGTPVLPGVMGMEGFAEVARALLPEFHVVELTDVDLLAPFKFYRDQPREVILRARLAHAPNQTISAQCELIGRRELRDHSEQETLHFVGRAKLAKKAPSAPKASANPAAQDGEMDSVSKDAVYGIYFHGPAYQVLDHAWRDNGHVVGTFASELPANHEPASQPTELAPRLIELCFQTAGVWEIGNAGRMALPTHVDRVVLFASPRKQGPLWAVVSPRENGNGVDAEIVDETGRVRVRLEGYRTIELPGELEATALAPIRAAMHTADPS